VTARGLTWLARLAAPLLLLLAAGLYRPDAGAEVRDFFNPLLPDGADPWVYRHADGRYYLTVSTGDNVTLIRSGTLTGLAAGERKVVWTPPKSGPVSKGLWAPELHFLRGKWYVYVAADDGENAHHRMYVLENPAADPFAGAFVLKGKLADPATDRWAIDGTVLELGGRLYFIWSGWEGSEDVCQILYIAPMSDPWTLAGPRVEISRPTHPWETRGAPPAVNEGPEALVRGRTVFLVYSASGSWTDHYCLGLLTASADADLLAPASWTKHAHPVFEGGNGVVAPGHCSFTTSPDGTEDWLLYHAAKFPGAGWDRSVRAQRFTWSADGAPRFGRPAPPNVPVPLPRGEPPRRRYEAEDAELGGAAQVAPDPAASRGAKVVSLDAPGSYLEFAVAARRAGAYHLSVRYANRDPDRAVATQALAVNGGPALPVRYPYAGPGMWLTVSIPVELKAGVNQIRFMAADHAAEIDCLDVVPASAGRGRAAP
jgi:GH43 family beta-xylosidase